MDQFCVSRHAERLMPRMAGFCGHVLVGCAEEITQGDAVPRKHYTKRQIALKKRLWDPHLTPWCHSSALTPSRLGNMPWPFPPRRYREQPCMWPCVRRSLPDRVAAARSTVRTKRRSAFCWILVDASNCRAWQWSSPPAGNQSFACNPSAGRRPMAPKTQAKARPRALCQRQSQTTAATGGARSYE